MQRLRALFLTGFMVLPLFGKEMVVNGPAEKWSDGVPMATPSLGLMALTGATSDHLFLFAEKVVQAAPDASAWPEDSPARAALTSATKAGTENRFSWLTTTEPAAPLASVRVDWLDAEESFKELTRRFNPDDGVVTTKFTRGTTGLTTQVFASDADDLVVIHLRANKPGALSFRIRLERPGEPAPVLQIQDRRVLDLRGKTSSAADAPSFAVRTWIFPMESEVTPTDKDISVLGEGEALVLVATATGAEDSPALTDLKSRLQKFGFGGEDHPDISLLWEGLLERHLKAHRALKSATPE